MRNMLLSGVNADVDTGAAEDVWAAGGAVTFPAAAAATTVVSSSTDDAAAGTGARTVRVRGLTAGFKEAYEDATLDGTNAVALTKTFLRIWSVEVLTAGSGGANAGTIDAKHSSTVLHRIPIGANLSRGAFFTAPDVDGRVRYRLKKVYVAITDVTDGVATFVVKTKKSDGLWEIRASLTVHGVSKPSDQMHVNIDLDQGEDVRVECAVSADNTEVTADLVLVGGSVGEISKQH